MMVMGMVSSLLVFSFCPASPLECPCFESESGERQANHAQYFKHILQNLFPPNYNLFLWAAEHGLRLEGKQGAYS